MKDIDHQAWSQLFSDHLCALRKTVETWRSIEGLGHNGSPYYELAKKNAASTEGIIESLEQMEDARKQAKGEVVQTEELDLKIPEPQPEKTTGNKRPKKKSVDKLGTEPVSDPSGLFSIDSNPMTAREVAAIESGKNKRNARDWDAETAQRSNAQTQLIPKRDSHPAKRHKQLHGDDQVKAEQRAQTFEQNVELRLKEKEEKQQQKLDRKRKRNSSDSFVGQKPNKDLENHLEPGLTPSKQRKKALKEQLAQAKEADPDITFADVKAANMKKAKRAAERLKSGYLADTEKAAASVAIPKRKKQKH